MVEDTAGDREEEGRLGRALEEEAGALEDVEVWADEPSAGGEGCPVHDFWR